MLFQLDRIVQRRRHGQIPRRCAQEAPHRADASRHLLRIGELAHAHGQIDLRFDQIDIVIVIDRFDANQSGDQAEAQHEP